ncbi:ABC transporter permease [Nocardioides sp.]|uniref:ABC transporter permease n=1 Tax=Nocardioides sp. TaxID=35761 RepID=UPI00356511DF
MAPTELVWFGLGLLMLVAGTVAVARSAGVQLGWTPLWALARASIQLSIVALILRGVLANPWTVVAFIALMLTTATWTASGRLKDLWHGRRAAFAGVTSGASIALVLVFALQLVDLDVRYLIALGGIVIGNAMTAATLAGRNFLRGTRHRRDEIEAWLSLGATPAQAHREIGQEAVRESLLPTLDQTRSTGLVTLPGAFVGALFGGASPAEAAQFQLVVLAGVALAMTVCGVVAARMLGRSPFIAVDE